MRDRLRNQVLLVHIKAIHAEVKGEYGSPKIARQLVARGLRISKDRVKKVMQCHGIKTRGRRKYVVTTDSRHSLPIAKNLLQKTSRQRR